LLDYAMYLGLSAFYYYSMCTMLGMMRDVKYGKMPTGPMVLVLILSPVIVAIGYAKELVSLSLPTVRR